MNLLSIDPGLNHAGIAFFVDGLLNHAWTFSPKQEAADAVGWLHIAQVIQKELLATWSPEDCLIAYEMPQILPGWRKGDLNAVLQVAGAAGAIVDCLYGWLLPSSAPVAVRPSEWTKGRTKKANHLRMWRRLNMFEQQRLGDSLGIDPDVLFECIRHGDEADLEHALDAVCIGLKVLGRFERAA